MTEFLVEAVKDIQGTIRAIDTKVSILLAALSIPLAAVADKISGWHRGVLPGGVAEIAQFAAFATYVFAIAVSVRTLSGIGDAGRHVPGARRQTVFYAGGLFTFSWTDSLLNRPAIRARRSLEDYLIEVPRTFADVAVDLTSEIMCLAYIRDLKHHRQRIAYGLTLLAAFLGFLTLVV